MYTINSTWKSFLTEFAGFILIYSSCNFDLETIFIVDFSSFYIN